MDDPVVADSAGPETETIFAGTQSAPKNSAGEIAEFFDDLKNRQRTFPNPESRRVVDGVELGKKNADLKTISKKYSSDYKPMVTSNKQNVYSINELISISKQVPEGRVEEIIFTLPKKKFWRLNHRQQDYGNQGRSMGHRGPGKVLNGLGNGKNLGGEDVNNLFEKKGSKGKYSRTVNGKKNSKFVKHDRGNFMEEKDITVNHDDLQALEGEFEPTGNSMADFESWKAKMKEMERRKKGVPPGESLVGSKSSLSKTSSSISDFLGLNKVQTDHNSNQVKSGLVETEKKDPDDEDNGLNKDFYAHPEATKGSFSRFSSFFTQSSSSSPLPTVRDESEGLANRNARNSAGENMSIPRNHNLSVPGGSKLLSFFNKEGGAARNSGEQAALNNGDQRQAPVNHSIVPPSQSSHGSASSQTGLRLTEEQPHPPQPQSQLSSHTQSQSLPQQQRRIIRAQPPSSPALTPDQLQTNNAFFQNLLNKGELQNQKRNPPIGPPPGVMLPPGVPPQGGRTPASMGMSGPFPIGMPPGPGAFPPGPLPTGQAGVPLAMQPLGATDGKTHDGNNLSSAVPPNNGNGVKRPQGTGRAARSGENGSEIQPAQPPSHPLQPGMVPPQFIPGMAPPGFPMIPPTFNPMYVPPQGVPPQGGLMPPPGGQGFFPAILPPAGNMNFNAFPLQPPPVPSPQLREQNSAKSKK